MRRSTEACSLADCCLVLGTNLPSSTTFQTAGADNKGAAWVETLRDNTEQDRIGVVLYKSNGLLPEPPERNSLGRFSTASKQQRKSGW